MTTPTPASPIPQKTAKWLVYSREHNLWWRAERCGYTVDRAKAGRYTQEEAESICKTVSRRVLDYIDAHPSEFAVLDIDPTDAAELERLREAKYQAELDMRTTAMSRDVPTAVSPRVWNAWITACDRLSAFEKTIGGGS